MLGPPVLPRARLHRLLTLATLAFCAALAVRGTQKGLRPGGNDFTIYYDSAQALLAGGDPLLVRGSIYLPSFDVAVVPFALLPYAPALWLWQACSLLALVWGWKRSLELAGPGLEARPWVPWVALLAVSRLADSTFAYGQVNHFTFALVAEACVRLRARRDAAAALAIGAGAALKILPGLLVFWLACRGAGRALLLALAASALLIALPPLAAMGPERALASFGEWRARVLAPVARGGEKLLEAREYVPGQSLTAAGYRTFSATPATSQGTRGPRANLFDWPLATTRRVVLALSLAHAALWAALVARRRRTDRADDGFAAEAGLALAMILVLGPVVQKAHMVWLCLPYAALLGVPSALRGARATLQRVLTALSIALVAGTSPALLGDGLATRLVSANVVFAGLECALAALALELWARRGPSNPPKFGVGAVR